jgi:hypothetical protein
LTGFVYPLLLPATMPLAPITFLSSSITPGFIAFIAFNAFNAFNAMNYAGRLPC